MPTISFTRFKNAVRRDIKNFGLLNTAKDYAFRAVNEITFFGVFRVMALDQIDPEFMDPDRRYECRFLNSDEIFAFSQHPDIGLSEKFVSAALKKGDQCYAILDGEFLASYVWYSIEPTLINDELRIQFARERVYMYNTFTHFNYRGQRLNAVGITRGLTEYLNRGFKGIVFCVEENNHRSLRSVSRLGAVGLGRVIALKFSGKYFMYHSPGCKGHRFIVNP